MSRDRDLLWEQFTNGTDEQARRLAGWVFGYLWDQDKFWDAVEAFFARKESKNHETQAIEVRRS